MYKKLYILLIFSILFSTNILMSNHDSHYLEKIFWDNTLSLPLQKGNSHEGLAGVYSGFIDNDLIIAGGANFPNNKPWEGGRKRWWNVIYTKNMSDSLSQWKQIENILPSPLAYGVTIQLPQGLLCIGGCDSLQCSNKVFCLYKQGNELTVDLNWPALPISLSNATGALLNNKIYLAGGHEKAINPEASSCFLMLDLNNLSKGWQRLPTWPGPARGYAVSVVQNNGFEDCFYLFSGRNYHSDGTIEILSDGYVYNPRLNQWKILNGKYPVMAGTAVAQGANHILLIGGSTQMLPGSDSHPGFSNNVYLYHTITQKIINLVTAPYPLAVTTNVVTHNNIHYITSGEIKPGIRTPCILSFKLLPYKRKMGLFNSMVIVLYFLVLVWIGYYFFKKTKNTDDYFKGGCKIPWWAVGLSIFGTGLSAITFMSIPAKSFATNWSYMVLNAGILMVVPIIYYVFIPFFRKMNITTAYEYLDKRFNTLVRSFCSLSFVLFQIGRIGIVLYLPAIAINVVTGFDIILCISLMGILSLIYTMAGGIKAVIWTDVFQVIVLLGGAFFSIIFIACNVDGGFNGIISNASAMQKFSLGSTEFDLQQSTLWTVLIASFFTNLTTYGTDQTMVQRYMSTETEKSAKKSLLTNAVLTIPATIIFFFVGTALFVFYQQHPQDLSMTITDNDAIFPWYIYSQFPQGLTGLLISGIMAAAMSTLSSSMNSAATAYVVDIHQNLLKRQSDLKTAKLATAILGVLGLAFAYMMVSWRISSLWDEFNKILGLVLGSMGGLFLLGMLTRRANSFGATVGIIGSVIVQLYFVKSQSVHLLLYTTTGVISCFLIGYIASLITPCYRKKINQYTIYKT